ncbi:MAG: histidinol-phosphate transaminase [Bacteroidales bacterium]|nr:MAG: histidinol-phosphate transaminase [Bacteroidales bacterium]
MLNINDLLRKNIQNLKPYSSARNEFSGDDVILLDANENPKVLSGLPVGINRYPDPLQKRVKEKLSGIKGVNSDNIFLGNGSDEAIDLALRCFCNPGIDSLAIFPPTYGMYKVCAAINDVNIFEYPLNANFEIDSDKFLGEIKPEVKVVIICNPNNPTANIQSKSSIKKIIERFQGIVILDEAYIDFCPEQSLVNELSKYPNLIILQTLSKAWALAGARVGIAMASKEIIDVFNKVKFPYNISNPSLLIAEQALDKENESKQRIEEIFYERNRLLKIITTLPRVLKVYPSSANFILVKTSDAKRLYTYLVSNGIIVRNRDSETSCKGCLRVTIGLKEENDRLVELWERFEQQVQSE